MSFTAYPSLYHAADAVSLKAQKTFLTFTIINAILLIIGTFLSVFDDLGKLWGIQKEYSLVMAAFYCMALIVAFWLGWRKYEKIWYSGRAVAESIKTSVWLYMMKSSPYDNDDASAKITFANLLADLRSSNKELAEALGTHPNFNTLQITPEMEAVRSKFPERRKMFYLEERVTDQLGWYTRKAAWNKRQYGYWFGGFISLQALALIVVLWRASNPDAINMWFTDVLVVIAAFALSWIQLKRFNELTTAYTLTALEIGEIQLRAQAIDGTDGEELANFAKNAEMAFSREHTQWAARKGAVG